jgi:predicted SprT family Zn-dependent metalloprotease
MITAQHKALVEAKIAECVAKVEKYYGIVMPKITVAYDIKGTTGGMAYYFKNLIRLNPTLFVANMEDFLENTVPHIWQRTKCLLSRRAATNTM